MNLPPIDVTGLNVLELPVKPRPDAEAGAFLQPVPYSACQHRGPFEVDQTRERCVCKACGETVSPYYVLDQLMRLESQWMRTRAAYQDEMKRLAERSSTKCRHCGEMTRISNK